MATVEYFAPTIAARIKAAASLAAILLWGATHHLWFSPIVEVIDSCDVCATLWATRFVVVYLSLLPLPFSLWFAYTADRILKSGQNPPPGSWLFFRVRLHRGIRARIGAYSLAAAAFAAALAPGFLAHKLGVADLFCIGEACGCQAAAKPQDQACRHGATRTEA